VSWPWRSPQATRQALTDRVRARYPPEERQRRLREIAYRQLLARWFAAQPAQKDVHGTELTSHVRREERRRLDAGTLLEPLPAALRLSDEQVADWRVRWNKATRGAPIEFDQAQVIAATFIDPVLSRAVDGRRWNAAEQEWI
jgi:hypothetical protein